MAKKKQSPIPTGSASLTPAQPEPQSGLVPTPPLSPEEELIAANADLLAGHLDEMKGTLLQMVRGAWTDRKLRRVVADEADMGDVDTGEVIRVFKQLPDASLLKFAIQHLEGRAAQKSTQQQPITINVIHQVPGHTDEGTTNPQAADSTDLADLSQAIPLLTAEDSDLLSDLSDPE